MFLQIENFLTADEVRNVRDLAARAKFIDGRYSNPHNTTKINVIGDMSDPAAQSASTIALAALQRNEEVANFVFPARMALPNLCRYGVGMTYGPHTDAAFLPISKVPLRSDVSCTLFVSDPLDYEGGELLIHLGSEQVKIKGGPGSAIFYASTAVHEVMPVRRGERLVIITFIQSQIPDQMQRDLLYSLGEVRALEGLKMDWRNRTQLDYVLANLHRMWSR